MNILALDTSTPRAAAALATTAGTVLLAPADPGQRHGRNLIPSLKMLLDQAGLPVRALDLIAVGLGPGSYTGLRVGLMAAKALAYAAKKPLVALDSLETIARGAPATYPRVTVIGDAQRGDLYTADFTRSAAGAPLVRATPTRIEPIADWSARHHEPTLVLGPGRARLDAPLADVFLAPEDDDLDYPDGRHLIELAREAHAAGDFADPWFLEPRYLRRSAAEDQWERKA